MKSLMVCDNVFLLRSGMREGHLLFFFFFQHCTGVGSLAGRLTSEFYISENQAQRREGPCAEPLCREREELSFTKLGQDKYT